MPYRANYPATVTEILNESLTFKPAALRAVRDLARSKPWQGSQQERLLKLAVCLAALSEAYAIDRPTLRADAPVGSDHYRPADNSIHLSSRLSVVTFLHEFGHARGFDERQTCRWSINLFRRCFPRSYGNCRHVRHVLVSNNERNA